MQPLGYLAIDESNHGKFPEVYVAAFSNNIDDISLKNRNIIGKARCLDNIEKVVLNSSYKHLIVTSDMVEEFGIVPVRLAVTAELISKFWNINKVLIDGYIQKSYLDELNKLFPEIGLRVEIKADQWYPLANIADQIAYYLGKYYTTNLLDTLKKSETPIVHLHNQYIQQIESNEKKDNEKRYY